MDFKAKIKDHGPALVILIVAAVARLTLLSIKPPHFDEGVNGWFVDQMTQTGFYHYDPTNYHGPLHFYILFLAQTLLGRHIWVLRLPLALMSLATVGLTIRFDRFIGRGAALWAAAAMAVSPGCVFYGRYAIHEYWLVFSLMLGAWGLFGLWQSGERKYFWAVWTGITVAVLTKETYILHFAACLLTLPCVWVLGRLSPAGETKGAAPQKWTVVDMTLGVVLFFGCVVFFYSGGFMDPHAPMLGLKGMFAAFGDWAHTGKVGNGHEKPWFYWLTLFGHYEWPSCVGLLAALTCVLPRVPRFVWAIAAAAVALWLGFCGAAWALALGDEAAGLGHANMSRDTVWFTWPYLLLCAAFLFAVICANSRTPRFIRALAIYGIGTLVAYSIIHYKTPWCIVSLTWPFLLLFGYGVDFALKEYGMPVGVLTGTVLAANICDMVALNFWRYTNPKEPYVYVQTFSAINDLMNPLNELVARDPANYQISGNILMDSYHPIPWLLGDFTNIGYYEANSNPTKMDADFLMVDDSRVDDVEDALHDQYFTEILTLRDAQTPSKLYLNAKTFQSVFPGRKPDFLGSSPTPTP
jgi:uncharacterized protein (TIGR03663 family)